jgi:hypothetical protein
MRGPAGVMALVLAETTAGGVFFLFLTPLWNEVRLGFFYLTGGIILAMALATAGTTATAQAPAAAGDAHLAIALSLATAGATLAWILLAIAKKTTLSRIVGVATVPLSVAMLFAFARTGDESTLLSFFQLLAGAVFIGAVLDGLLLGHWYLTERKLPRKPILRMTWSLIGAVVLEAVAVAMGGFGAPVDSSVTQAISPILTVAGVASWIAIGMVALTGLIAVFIRITLQGDRPAAVQSATGFFYLAVITAFTAEVAAKVHFLP